MEGSRKRGMEGWREELAGTAGGRDGGFREGAGKDSWEEGEGCRRLREGGKFTGKGEGRSRA